MNWGSQNYIQKHLRIYATICKYNCFNFHQKNPQDNMDLPKKVYRFAFHTALLLSVTSVMSVVVGQTALQFTLTLTAHWIYTWSLKHTCLFVQAFKTNRRESTRMRNYSEQSTLISWVCPQLGLDLAREGQIPSGTYCVTMARDILYPILHTSTQKWRPPLPSASLHYTTEPFLCIYSIYVIFYHYDKITYPGDARANLFHVLLI